MECINRGIFDNPVTDGWETFPTSFMIQDSSLSMDPDRHLTLQNAYNFRDIGGLRTHDGRRVQKGLLYRSDALSRLASSDQEAIAGLGLKTVVDL
ncbi:MAG TPA: tyrosine-protein phosphatase, partial [Polyangiaceae bacterium]|nr:tyrosine-protein phosphatase [Polyangiaceae bacterium]